MKEIFTVDEAASYLNVSGWTIRDMIRKQEIPSFRIRRRIGLRKTELDQWISEQMATMA